MDAEHTPSFEEYPVTIEGEETILLGCGVDPGDGDAIMVFVDGTPIDDLRRPALLRALLRAIKSLAPMRAALGEIAKRGANPRTAYGYGTKRPWGRLADDIWRIAVNAIKLSDGDA